LINRSSPLALLIVDPQEQQLVEFLVFFIKKTGTNFNTFSFGFDLGLEFHIF
jgi:hypothetical protein